MLGSVRGGTLGGAKSFERSLGASEFLEDRLSLRMELMPPEALSPFIGTSILSVAPLSTFRTTMSRIR